MNALNEFKETLNRKDIVNWIRSGLIGEDVEIQRTLVPKEIIYADYVASGRILDQVEDFISEKVLPFFLSKGLVFFISLIISFLSTVILFYVTQKIITN